MYKIQSLNTVEREDQSQEKGGWSDTSDPVEALADPFPLFLQDHITF